MSPCGRAISTLWKRGALEFRVELPLLKERWRVILAGACFQYAHGMATQLAHRMHHPLAQPLHDVGFDLLPELGLANEWVSELIFTSLFVSFVLWSFSPFVFPKKRFYTAVLYARFLTALVACQALRIVSFTVTQLPAPNYHCRDGEPTAVREMPEAWWGHVAVDLKRQATHGCGDLIFSSHTIFALMGALTYHEYGTHLATKVLVWAGVSALSVLIVASRKHYTVDVVIAWYVVPLVFHALARRWTTKRHATEGTLLGDVVYAADVDAGGALLKGIVVEKAGDAVPPASSLQACSDKGGCSGACCQGSKVGQVIGILANGFVGMNHPSPGGDKGGSPPGTPPLQRHNNSGNVSSSSSDDGNGGSGFRKTSPLSSMRPRGSVASSADAYHRDFEDGMGGHVLLGEQSNHSSTQSSRSSSISGAQLAGSSNASSALCRVS